MSGFITARAREREAFAHHFFGFLMLAAWESHT